MIGKLADALSDCSTSAISWPLVGLAAVGAAGVVGFIWALGRLR